MSLINSGSYLEEDVIFLLKNINDLVKEQSTEEREYAIQNGIHYSQMLPIEYKPSEEYMNIFFSQLDKSKLKLAYLISILSEKIYKNKPENLILVSLARAGTPIGILIKRYLKFKYHISIPHYCVSIIRDVGIDKTAMEYILNNHKNSSIQFVDGWTGKGVIQGVLIDSCESINMSLGIKLDSTLGVLSDPAYCTDLCGTHEDFLIPSACLNATVSGLISRTVFNKNFIYTNDFHGAKFYENLLAEDVSKIFVDTISNCFPILSSLMGKNNLPFVSEDNSMVKINPSNPKGLEDVKLIQKHFNIDNINHIKPGVGETTRVLLRRIPWKILVKSNKEKDLEHILNLSRDKQVDIEIFDHMSYSCCGIIKNIKDDNL